MIFSVPACGGKNENQTTPKQNDADETAETADNEQNDADETAETADIEQNDDDDVQNDADNWQNNNNDDNIHVDDEVLPDPCEPNPCGDDIHIKCEPEDVTNYRCRCETGYLWDGEKCDDIPECSTTSGTPCIDAETDLMWSAKSEKSMDWGTAETYCETLDEGGYSDWFLPNSSVLYTLVRNCDDFYNGCEANYDGFYSKFGETDELWSSTYMARRPELGVPSSAYTISFSRGRYYDRLPNNIYKVRCVRIEKTEREAECGRIPQNAVYNKVSKIQQTWNFSYYSWQPSLISLYSTTASTTECRFKCDNGYKYTGAECRTVDLSFPKCSPSSETPCVDASSGLIWSAAKKESDKMDWEAAVSYCNDLSEGGFDDWHLPTINELRTLVQNCDTTALGGACKIDDPNCLYSGCNTDNGCSQDDSGKYSKFGDPGALWSSSVMMEAPSSSTYDDFVWVLNFRTAEIIYILKKYNDFILYLDLHVRCVR